MGLIGRFMRLIGRFIGLIGRFIGFVGRFMVINRTGNRFSRFSVWFSLNHSKKARNQQLNCAVYKIRTLASRESVRGAIDGNELNTKN